MRHGEGMMQGEVRVCLQKVPLPVAPSDQLHLFDGQMTYGPHCYIPISSLPNMPHCGPTNHESLCCTVRDLLSFHLR